MATEIGAILDVSYPAGEDLSACQHRFVYLTSGEVFLPNENDSAALCVGVLQNAPAIGAAAVVRTIGISKFVIGEACAVGSNIIPEWVDNLGDAGKGILADTAKDLSIGRCLKGGAEDDLGEIILSGAVHQVLIAT